MKYTFINEEQQPQTVDVPDEFLRTNCRNLGITTKEAILMFLSDEGYMSDAEVARLTEKAKSNSLNGANNRKGGAGKRTRKPDEVKRSMIASLMEFMSAMDKVENCSAVNPERIIAFTLGSDNYELVLQKKRKSKNE